LVSFLDTQGNIFEGDAFLFVVLSILGMKTIVRIALMSVLSLSATRIQAQDPELTQFYAAPVYTNPALAGSAVCGMGMAAGRVALNYRNQWPSLPGTFRSLMFSWDQHVPSIGGGLGAMVFHDIAGSGLLTSTAISGVYSYLLPLNHGRLFMRFGLQGGVVMKSLDFNRLKFADMILPTQGFVLPTGEQQPANSVTYPNFNAGWIMYTSKFYFGAAAHNITEPNWSFYQNPDEVLPRRYTVHTGAVIPLSHNRYETNTFSPNALFMMQRNFTQLNLGFYANKGPLVTGLWFRQTFGNYGNSDAVMMLVGFRKDKFKFGYSYDFTVSDGRSAIPSSHEVSATLDWCIPPGRKPFKPLHCPEF
jgi:type IX secretion system PorP/SprF family membrane protein